MALTCCLGAAAAAGHDGRGVAASEHGVGVAHSGEAYANRGGDRSGGGGGFASGYSRGEGGGSGYGSGNSGGEGRGAGGTGGAGGVGRGAGGTGGAGGEGRGAGGTGGAGGEGRGAGGTGGGQSGSPGPGFGGTQVGNTAVEEHGQGGAGRGQNFGAGGGQGEGGEANRQGRCESCGNGTTAHTTQVTPVVTPVVATPTPTPTPAPVVTPAPVATPTPALTPARPTVTASPPQIVSVASTPHASPHRGTSGASRAKASAGGPLSLTGPLRPTVAPIAGAGAVALTSTRSPTTAPASSTPAKRVQPPATAAPPAASKPNVIARIVRVVPEWVWLVLAGAFAFAAAATAVALISARRAQRQARQFVAVSAAALTDPLTGALNRRGFIEAAERELARARRYDRPFLLAYVDVRGLKAVNDSEGHSAGDLLLKEAVGLLKDSARADDVVGRLGGDELGLLLVEIGPQAAAAVTGRIRANVEARRASLGVRSPWDLTIGTATFPKDGTTVEELLRAADLRLYEQRGIALR